MLRLFAVVLLIAAAWTLVACRRDAPPVATPPASVAPTPTPVAELDPTAVPELEPTPDPELEPTPLP
jgi:hypothetical protein